ncbi:cytochrome P450 [Nesidiocoris tenuis]|uniref:Cytochrome P450 n=1 Tax=Nesidiocoris tenuis TaxID=355587 RepID=A0ABN7AHL4_9HEMI|nr:cytochrome P450 [Nesidiocoris tenuis]
MFRKLPGPKGYPPILGLALELPFLSNAELLPYIKKQVITGYDRLGAVWLMGLPGAFVNSPEDIEVVLSSMKYIEKGQEYNLIRPWLQEGLLVSSGQKWHSRRKLLTPTFHFKILEDKSRTMYQNAKLFVDKLLEKNGKPFDPFMKISRCTLDIICESAMGVALNSQNDGSADYVALIGRVTRDIVYRVVNTQHFSEVVWQLTKKGYQNSKDIEAVHDFTQMIITERRQLYEKEKKETLSEEDFGIKKRKAFLDSMLELDISNQAKMTDSDIREEVDTFLFEGHDTTAALILFLLFELGHHQDIQELAYQEQYEIFGDDTREATLNDIQQMTYLERVIKECLRLYPSVPWMSRTLNDDLTLKGLPTIPAGANIMILPIFLHRNPKYYPDPEKFDPDRFLPEECAKRHPFAYIPFSAGPRNCIGQKFAMLEIKTTISTLLRFAKVNSITKRSEVNLVPLVILRPDKPIYISVTPRT